MSRASGVKEAPIYWGGKLWFIDNQDSDKRGPVDNQVDNDVMDALIAQGIGDKTCPTAGEWMQFCFISSILYSETGKSLEMPDRLCSWKDIEQYSWGELWRVFGDIRDDDCYSKSIFNKEFTASILRIFIPRCDGDSRDYSYNHSHFVQK